MDKSFLIKIVRASDSAKFTIGDGSDWKVVKNGLDGFGDIENTITYEENAIADGGQFTSEHLSKVDRTIKFAYLHYSSNDTARAQLLSFFRTKDNYKVYITHGNKTRWAEGKVYKFKLGVSPDVEAKMEVSITFLFANPFWNSVDNFGKNIAALTGKIAFPYMCSITDGTAKGTTGGLFNFAQQVTIYNDGDADTNCKAILSAAGGEVENPKLIINGEYIRLNYTMQDGEEIEIDFTAFPPTVRKDGVNFIGHCDRTSAFDNMAIVRGDNVIEYDADNGSSHLNTTIYYYKKYEAI